MSGAPSMPGARKNSSSSGSPSALLKNLLRIGNAQWRSSGSGRNGEEAKKADEGGDWTTNVEETKKDGEGDAQTGISFQNKKGVNEPQWAMGKCGQGIDKSVGSKMSQIGGCPPWERENWDAEVTDGLKRPETGQALFGELFPGAKWNAEERADAFN